MRSRSLPPARLPALIAGAALLAGAGLPAYGQAPGFPLPPGYCPPPGMAFPNNPGPYPAPAASQPAPRPPAMPRAGEPAERPTGPQQPERPQQPQQPEQQQQQQQGQQAQEPNAGQEQAAATGAETAAVSGSPNMLGHLLYGSRAVTFSYGRAAGPINVANPGATSIVNPAVADDESPIPRDRVGFRFNFYDDSQQVTGFGPPVFTTVGGARVGTSFAQTKDYNVEEYNFYFEKTFLDGRASLELRVPFDTGLSNNLNLSAGQVVGPPNSSGTFPVVATPGQSLGTEGTQFGNMTLLFKGLAYSGQTLALTGGVALGIPTGDNSSVNITDFAGPSVSGAATVERERQIHIDNEFWSLSPFLAYLWTPSDRFFSQGFVQFDFPLNESTINYTETTPLGALTPASLFRPSMLPFGALNPPFSVRDQISEQALAQVDWGAGYWLLRDPNRSCVTGIAPSLELHYTATLQDAHVVNLPGDTLLNVNPATGRFVQPQPPRVGNLRNHVDILDLTVATTFLISDRATVATGFAFPLLGDNNRTFDWEYQLQLNYYFGGLGRRFAPNF